MSERNSGKIMKSCSEGELLDKEEERGLLSGECDVRVSETGTLSKRYTTEAKLKRTFTLPRNLFASKRVSKRRAKNREGSDSNSGSSTTMNKNPSLQTVSDGLHYDSGSLKPARKKMFRRPSFKNFLNNVNRIVQHMSSTRPPKNNRAYERRKTECSLSSNDIRVPAVPPTPAEIGENIFASFGDHVPGVIGLRNNGNTCFINAILQCLGHTDVLAEYFVLDQYKADLTRRNKHTSRKFGTRGEVTEQLALLLKAIWTCRYDPELLSRFKSVVDKYGTQYRGSQQHDAQEFLLWLLDKVHQDLNTATKRRYKRIKNAAGRPDEIVANETLANHLRCDSSFVQAVFQAQFRSALTCPECRRQSCTFDPFRCVSIPIPQRQRRPVFCTVLYLSQQPRQVKLGLTLSISADVRDLRDALANDTGIPESQILLTEIYVDGFHRTLSDSQPLTCLREDDPLYCIEFPRLKEPSEENGAFILLCWISVIVSEDGLCKRFGSPYTLQVGRETSYEDLQKLLLKEMSFILHDDVLVSSQQVPLFRMRIEDGLETACYLEPSLDHPLYQEAVDQVLGLCDEGSGLPHLKLVLEWSEEAKKSVIADDNDAVEELASAKQLRDSPPDGTAVTLEECFQLYTCAEVLGPEDAWHCPFCNRKQEVVKTLGLWSLPDILVIHLKRFRQASRQRSTAKLGTLVEFPLLGFDMTPHLSHRGPPASVPNGWSPWKKPNRRNVVVRPEDNVYDLYAVCNHHGENLQGGHYTALCRNPFDGAWYSFDDARVERVSDDSIITPGAYILFYQRRPDPPSNGLSHWARQMLPVFRSRHNVRSAEDLGAQKENNFNRGSRSYSTLQHPGLAPRRSSLEPGELGGETEYHSDTEISPVVNEQETPMVMRKFVARSVEALKNLENEDDEKMNEPEETATPIIAESSV